MLARTIPQLSDLGTYSAESIRQLGNEERLWLYNNAFRADTRQAFPAKEEYGKKCSSSIDNIYVSSMLG